MSPAHARSGYQPTCVVAGAVPGLGLAIAERYASEGFVSYLLLRRPQRVFPMVQVLRVRGLDVIAVACDVSNVPSIQRALSTIKERSGRCDVLIYNAYDVTGAVAFVNGTVQEMRERKNGAMLFSGCGAALRAFVDCVADDVEGDGIRVGMMTMRAPAHQFNKIAELYWEFFATDTHFQKWKKAQKNGSFSKG